MEKIVRYNGGTSSYLGCTSPAVLKKGQEYEVIAVEDKGYQTDYYLKGINGHFNSCWFDVVSTVNTFMAYATNAPRIGEVFKCYRMEVVEGSPQFFYTATSLVRDVEDVGNNIYNVKTRNSTYIVKVG